MLGQEVLLLTIWIIIFVLLLVTIRFQEIVDVRDQLHGDYVMRMHVVAVELEEVVLFDLRLVLVESVVALQLVTAVL